jgi:LPXTG-site transpeptidase (sortase) family protein
VTATIATPVPQRRVRGVALPAIGSRLQLVRAVLVMVCALSFTLLLQLTVISQFQQRAAQQQAFDHFRSQLADGTAPVGPTDAAGDELAAGTSVAYIEIPALGVKQVIGEGTSPATLFDGPGHRRDTPLPGQQGISMVLGRRASFGGPFAGIGGLETGDEINVTTGQGEFRFEVVGVRKEGDPGIAPPPSGGARLLLVTAEGAPFLPDGVVRVDADLVGDAVVGAPRVRTADTLPSEERIMAGDARTLWVLALWLLVALGLALGATWAWHRWGHARTWVVFLPPLLFVGLAASGEVARLLPNLL